MIFGRGNFSPLVPANPILAPKDALEFLAGKTAASCESLHTELEIKIDDDFAEVEQDGFDFHRENLSIGPYTLDMAIHSSHEFTSRRDRRQSAPETTLREAEYIDRLSKSRTPVVVKLIDGEEIKGWIEYYDKDIIRITRGTQPNLFIYKNRVKYLFEDPDSVRRSRGASA